MNPRELRLTAEHFEKLSDQLLESVEVLDFAGKEMLRNAEALKEAADKLDAIIEPRRPPEPTSEEK